MHQDENLALFGHSFQRKAIVSLLSDSIFTERILDILKEEYFESDVNRFLIKTIKDYFVQYKTVPTLDVFKVKIKELDNEILKVSAVDQLKEVYRILTNDISDIDFVKEKFSEFCKNQSLKLAILKSVDLLNSGKYEDIKKVIDSAMNSGNNTNIGTIIGEDNVDNTFEKLSRSTIPTPWVLINELTAGGLAGGELGVIIGAPGSGKTHNLIALGAAAVKKGYNVIHYTLELSETYCAKRFYSYFSGIPSHDLQYNKEEIKEKLNSEMKGRLIVKYFPPGRCSVSTLEAHIQRTKILNFIPDIIIIDYADLMSTLGSKKDAREEVDNVYKDIMGLAGELQVPIYTASQANRCLTLNTIVETINGKIEIKNLKENDFILTHKGFKKVNKIFPIEKQVVYKIKLKSGKEILCSSNHEFPVKYGLLKSIATGLKIGDKLLSKK